MQSALLYGLRDLRLVGVDKPSAGPSQVVVRVHACGICPTDLRKFNTLDGGHLHLPLNLGHEFVGTVVEAGTAASGFEPGMRILGEGYAGYAEFALIDLDDMPSVHAGGPVTIPISLSNSEATFAEPVADCLHAIVDQAALHSGDSVLVIGGGTMGQLLSLAAQSTNCSVIVSEPVPSRRTMALALGAHTVLDPHAVTLHEAVRESNDGRLVDAVVLSIGESSLIEEAIRCVRRGGRVVLFGGFPRPAQLTLDPNTLHYNEVALVGSEWVGVAPYSNIGLFRTALRLIADGTIPVAKLISATYPLSDIQDAFAAAASIETFKVIITM